MTASSLSFIDLSPATQQLLGKRDDHDGLKFTYTTLSSAVEDETVALLSDDRNPPLVSKKKSSVSSGMSIDRARLIHWLNQPNTGGYDFNKEALRATLLKDLATSLQKKPPLSSKPVIKAKHSLMRRLALYLFAFLGILKSVAEGFDGILSMMGLLGKISTGIAMGVASIFAGLSIAVYFGFDLIEISKNLGIAPKHTPKMLDAFLEQIKQIKIIRKSIEQHSELTSVEKKELITMLKSRLAALDPAKTIYQESANKNWLVSIKYFVAITTGCLFFSSGFFAGQSLGLGVFKWLHQPEISIVSWQILAFSVAIGIAAFSIYWFLERPGLTKLVGSWFGFDQDKIALFTDEEKAKIQFEKLDTLEKHLTGLMPSSPPLEASADRSQVEEILDTVKEKENVLHDWPAAQEELNEKMKAGRHQFGFTRSLSLSNLRSQERAHEGDCDFAMGGQ